MLATGVVEIKHRSHSVYAQPIDMIFVQPEHGAGHQEAAHLVATVVIDVRVPVGMEAEPPIRVLEKMRAVEVGKAVPIGREVRWNPIENDSDATLMQIVDEKHEILGRAVASGRREITRGLISPGSVKRMLHDRQQLDVSELHALDVVGH